MRKLIEMKGKMYNSPHLIDAQTFDWVEGIINAQTENPKFAIEATGRKKEREVQYNPDTQVGLISISGPLTYQEYEAVCGEKNVSYQQILGEMQEMASLGAKTVVLDTDSPGGEAFGMMETGRSLRKIADENGIKLIAYVDGLAASAGYGLASSAHEVIANPESELGSIGVVVKLRNINKAMKEMGVEDTYIFAGKNKIPFTKDGEWDEAFLEDIQGKVDALYEAFTQYVASMRGISVEAVKATEAKTFLGDKAVALGLADKTMTREEFYEYLADIVEGDTVLSNKLFGKKKEEMTMTAEEKAQLEALQANVTSLTAALEGKTSEMAAIATALEEKNAALEAASAALAEANAKLAAIAEAEAAAAKAAEEARVAARKSALVEAVGEAEAETLFESLSALPDAAYEAVIGKMKAAADVEAEQDPNFKEVGHGGKKEATASLGAAERKLLEEKYGRKA